MTENDIAFYGSLFGPLFLMLAVSAGALIRDARKARNDRAEADWRCVDV